MEAAILNKPPVFIVGAGRSGTTLLRLILNAHSALHCGPEDQLAIRHLFEWCRWDMSPEIFVRELFNYWTVAGRLVDLWEISEREDDILEAVRASDKDFSTWIQVTWKFLLKNCASEGHRCCMKTPHYVFHLNLLKRLFPDLKVIHLIRDGRDVIHSFLTGPLRWHINPPNYCYGAYYWKNCNRAGERFGINYPENYLRIRFEDLLTDARSVVLNVCRFIGESFEEQMLNYHQNNKELRLIPENEKSWHKKTGEPIDRTNIYKWKKCLSDHDIWTFQIVAGDVLRENGYELTSMPQCGRLQMQLMSRLVVFETRDLYRILYRRYYLLRRTLIARMSE